MTTGTAADPRCSVRMRAAGADPVGTAGSYDGFLLVPWPLPWPHDLSEVEELAPVRAALAGRPGTVRIQGTVPEAGGPWQMVLHSRGDGPFAGYHRRAIEVPAGAGDGDTGRRLAAAATALLSGGGSSDETRDVLVCTHGRRDRCCGSFGTDLWQHLAGRDLGPDVALWRTSHTGGHRYAATMLVLPEGTAWGFLDVAGAVRVVRREGPVAEVLGSYRGCAGLASPAVQALERAVLGQVGWPLLDTGRRGDDSGTGLVTLSAGPAGRWEATVRPGRVLAVPQCGEAAEGPKTTTEQTVSGLRRVG